MSGRQGVPRLGYRGIHTLLAEWTDPRNVLGLRSVPHFTTLHAEANRLLRKERARQPLEETLTLCRQRKLLPRRTKLAAVDSTGLGAQHISSYYTRRCDRHRGHTKRSYRKLWAVCGTANHLVLGLVVDRGPKPHHLEDERTLLVGQLYDPLKQPLLIIQGHQLVPLRGPRLAQRPRHPTLGDSIAFLDLRDRLATLRRA